MNLQFLMNLLDHLDQVLTSPQASAEYLVILEAEAPAIEARFPWTKDFILAIEAQLRNVAPPPTSAGIA